MKLMSILVLACIALSGTAAANDLVEIEYLNSFLLANAEHAVIADSLAYVAMAHGMAVVDLRDASAPTLVSELATRFACSSIDKAGNIVWMATSSWIAGIDVSDPSLPVMLNSFDVNTVVPDLYIMDIAAQGDYLYVATWLRGLLIFDVSDPSAPVWIGIYGQEHISVVKIVDSIAYLGTKSAADMNAFQTVDVSDPTAPALLSDSHHGNTVDIAVAGDLAYVAGDYWNVRSQYYAHGLFVYDVSDPANPRLKGFFPNDHPKGVWARADRAYFGGQGGLRVLDVSVPTSPDSIGHVTGMWGGNDDWHGGLAGDFLWILNPSDNSLKACDVTIESAPPIVGEYRFPSKLEDVHIYGDHAFIANGRAGMLVADISDPVNPEIVCSYQNDSLKNVLSVWADSQYAFVGSGYPGAPPIFESISEPLSSGFQVLDVSDPTDPIPVASCAECGKELSDPYPVAGPVVNIDVFGGYLHGEIYGMRCDWVFCWPYYAPVLADVNDPLNPEKIYPADLLTWRIRSENVSNGYAYLINTDSLVVYSVADPTAPIRVGACGLPSAGRFGAVSDNVVLIYTWDGWQKTLYTVDVSVPTDPALSQSFPLPDSVNWLGWADPFVLVTKQTGGDLIAIDPFNPTRQDTLHLPLWFEEIQVSESAVYAYGDYGIATLRINSIPCCGRFTDGRTGNIDCDENGKINLSDILRLIDRVFLSKQELCCEANGNVNGDPQGRINIVDIVRLVLSVYCDRVETAACD